MRIKVEIIIKKGWKVKNKINEIYEIDSIRIRVTNLSVKRMTYII